ncbi:histidine ammonia-lyase [soil metagenome]
MGVTITHAAALTIEELLDVSVGAEIELGDDARATIAGSRAVIDRMLEGDEPVYGLNTGVGHMKDSRVPVAELRSMQEMLVMTHAGGTGSPLATDRVRAAMTARLNGIARGGSGASPRVADVLVEMLNAGVHPVVPSRGSVGACDLGQLASIGQVMIGRGRAELAGDLMSGGEALQRAGIEPLRLEPKDGLTILSSNAVSIGEAAIAGARARHTARHADVVAALSLEATHGNPSIARPVVGAAKPFPGQIDSCVNITAALDGSPLLEPGAARSVQDPLSFRVIPQVHGAFREAVGAAHRAVELELNGRGDNPLVSIEDATMVHNGNFHPLVMAIAFDQLRIALAHVGQISERRMSHLWDAFFERVAGAGAPPPGRIPAELFGMSLRYPGAATFAELKQMAAPATLDVPPLDMGIEDHATGAPLSVRKTGKALDLVEEILSIEVLMANDVLDTERPARSLGTGTAGMSQRAREAIGALADDRSGAEAQRLVAAALFAGDHRVP